MSKLANDMSQLENIQGYLDEYASDNISYSDVTTNKLSDVFGPLGYEIRENDNETYDLAKVTSEKTEYASLGITGSSEPELSDDVMDIHIVGIEQDNVDNTKIKTTLATTYNLKDFIDETATPTTFGVLKSAALYMGFKLTDTDYTANKDYWDSVLAGTFSFNPLTLLSNGQLYIDGDVLDKIYDVLAEVASDLSDGSEYEDSQGNVSPMRFTRSIDVHCVCENTSYRDEYHYTITCPSDCIFEVGTTNATVPSTASQYIGRLRAVLFGPSGATRSYVRTQTAKRTNKTTGDVQNKDAVQTVNITFGNSSNYSITLDGVTYYTNTSAGGPPLSYGYTTAVFGGITESEYVLQPYPVGPNTTPSLGSAWYFSDNRTKVQGGSYMTPISGATYPTEGGDVATTYPAWYGNRMRSNARYNSHASTSTSGLQNEHDYIPLSPLNDSYISGADATTQAQLHALSQKMKDMMSDIDSHFKEAYKQRQNEQTLLVIDAGGNPYDPSKKNTGKTPPPSSTIPDISAEKIGFLSTYHPTAAVLNELAVWLWSTFDESTFKKLFLDPMELIISLHRVFFTPKNAKASQGSLIDDDTVIRFGFIDTGKHTAYIDDIVQQLDCGEIFIPEYYSNALDYEPFTEVLVYLPFIGFKTLSANDVIGKTINIVYNIDVTTGSCVALINVKTKGSNAILYSFSGNCSSPVPLSSTNYNSLISGLIGTCASAGATIATGGAAAPFALMAGANTLNNSKFQIERSGALTGNLGVLGVKKPYIIVKRPVSRVAYKYNEILGYPASVHVRLQYCSGFTRVKEIELDYIKATEKEKDELRRLLKEGVILPDRETPI